MATKYWELIAIFNLLKIKMSIDIFCTEKCGVTFGFKYIINLQGLKVRKTARIRNR